MTHVEKSPAARPTTIRQVARLKLGLGRLDGRSSIAIRCREIIRELESTVRGGLTPLRRRAIERAALMTVLAEDLAGRRLQGEAIPLDAVLRAEGCARRAVKAVLAERPPQRRGGLQALEPLGIDR
jgi:hypothetical protein